MAELIDKLECILECVEVNRNQLEINMVFFKLNKPKEEVARVAWLVASMGLSKKNTIHKFAFSPSLNDVKTIFYTAVEEKCKFNLYAPVHFIGVNGIQKLSKDILGWKRQLDEDSYKRCLLQIVEYAGVPPSLPDKVNMPEVRHTEARLEFAGLMQRAAVEYQQELFQLSSQHFEKSGQYIETLAYMILDIAESKPQMSNEIKDILEEIASVELNAYEAIEQIFQ